MHDWRRQGLGLQRIAVNVSSQQLKQREFSELVRTLLAEFDLPAAALELEITEGLYVEKSEQVSTNLRELAALGVALAIDDFGTGYSSLSYLSRFPASVLKLDRSFIVNVPDHRGESELVKSIIGMARQIDKHVIVEGIETAEQLEFLRHSGCHQIQGYYISRPLPADELAVFVRRYAAAAAINTAVPTTGTA